MPNRLLAAAVVALALTAATSTAVAAPPANDDYADATPLTIGTDVSASTIDATAEPGEPTPVNQAPLSDTCASVSVGPQCTTSVWYTFQTATAGTYTIETCDGGSDIDTVLGVFTGDSVTTTADIADSDDAGNCAGGFDDNGSQVSFSAVANTLYHVEVAGYAADQGSFYLRAYAGAAVSRRQPDTAITRDDSFANQGVLEGDGPGATSGLRHTPSFAFISTAADATFACSLDGTAYAACSSPVSLDGLVTGSAHTFAVRATAAGVTDPTPAEQRFTVDATPPETSLTGPSGTYASQSAQWIAATSVRNRESEAFVCGVDSMPVRVCESASTFTGLCQGAHSFQIAAWSDALNIDPTPSVAQIAETAGPPCAAPSIGSPTTSPGATSASVGFTANDGGAGARVRLDYGPTTAYGDSTEDALQPSAADVQANFFETALAPGTVYHYRATITSPFGTASTTDGTFTTDPLPAGQVIPVIAATGTPVVSGHYAVHIPFTVDAGTATDTSYGVAISDSGPTTADSETIEPESADLAAGGVHAVAIDLVDLTPGTTYHYRAVAENADVKAVGSDATFTVPPLPVAVPIAAPATIPAPAPLPPPPPVVKKAHFKLKSSAVSFATLAHGSTGATIKLRKLPGKSKVTLTLTIGSDRVSVSKTASSAGSVTITIKLSKTLRTALASHSRTSVKLRVSVTPPGDTASSVSLTSKLKVVKAKKKKHRHKH
jgi:hypothetical protein